MLITIICAVLSIAAALFAVDAGIQLNRINRFSEFLTGYINGCSKRAQEAIKAGDYDWERFYTMQVEPSFDSLIPFSFRRYSRDWPSFLVHKPNA